MTANLLKLYAVTCLLTLGCSSQEGSSIQQAPPTHSPASGDSETMPTEPKLALATLGAGCFWCVEAVLEQIDGVTDVTSGYMGGSTDDPSYEDVCSGKSGHAEVVQVSFDPSVISYPEVLDWFWRLHDPTTLNQQGADIGTQYRSAIFVHDEIQRAQAQKSRAAADASGVFSRPIVTEITPASRYYAAEEYHQDYYRSNRKAAYCQVVIRPKLDKLGLKD